MLSELKRRTAAAWAALSTRSGSTPVLGRRFRLDWGGSAALAGVSVSPDSALTLSAYFAAINAISTDVGNLPWRVYRKGSGGVREEVADHPINRLLWAAIPTSGRSPIEGRSSKPRVTQAWMAHALGWGDGFLEIRRSSGDGLPVELRLLDPGQTTAEQRAADGGLYYRSGSRTLSPDQVLHLAGLGFDGLRGYSVARYGSGCIGLSQASEIYGARFFGSGGRPSGVLEVPRGTTEVGARNLRESWEALHGGAENSNRVAILEDGVKFQPFSIPPEEAQFLQTRQFQISEIARWFRMPPHKLGDYSQMQLASAAVEASNLDYLTTTLDPWCTRIEWELNLKLLTAQEQAAGYYVEHILASLLRADLRGRAEYNRQSLSAGWETRNEVRAREGLNPIAGGDEIFVPVNYVPLSRALAAPAAPADSSPFPVSDAGAV
jgi:HK97 family phage portal protein